MAWSSFLVELMHQSSTDMAFFGGPRERSSDLRQGVEVIPVAGVPARIFEQTPGDHFVLFCLIQQLNEKNTILLNL